MKIDGTRPSRLVLLVITAVLVGSGLGTLLPSGTAATAAGEKSVKLAWFSTEPKDGTSARTVASKVSHVYLGSHEYGEELQAAGYDGQVMQYKLASEVEGPGPYANASAACNSSYVPLDNQIANKTGDFCRYLHPNESWFLHNGKGQRLVGEWNGRYYYHMNPASSGWQSFARQRLASELSSRGFDGVHLDNVELERVKALRQLHNSDGVIKEYPTEEGFQNAWVSYLKVLSDALRSQWQVWANFVCDRNTGSTWEKYLPYVDGGMVEAFATGYSGMSAENWHNQLRQFESALRQGKSVIALSQGNRSDTTRQTFALASYLLITDGQDAYFRYSNSQSYTQFWDYANYGVALGAAKGARYQTGTTWRRDFACGYVVVDPAARTGRISTQACDNDSPAPSPAPDSGSSAELTFKGIAHGQSASGSIAVEIVSSVKIGRVVFYLDGQWVSTEGVAPYFLGGDDNGVPYGFNTRKWPNGNHVLKAEATDANGRTITDSITINFQNPSGPYVTVKGLSTGQTVSGSVAVEAVPSVAATQVDFYLDDRLIGSEGTAPYFLGGDDGRRPYGFTTRQWSNGNHVLKVVATDTRGNAFSQRVWFTVDN